MTQQAESVLTPEIKAMIGQTSEVVEMHGVMDKESIRLFALGIPDQDPHYWDEELANPKYGGLATPPMLLSYIVGRKPPWEEDKMDEIMNDNWFDDGGGGLGRREEGLPRVPTHLRRHLHAGDEVEILRYPKIGDRIFYQSKYVDIQEKQGREGMFLLITSEQRFWNQDDETICIQRTLGISR